MAHWERGWGVAEGRFALWVGCAVGSGGWLGQRGTWCGCPHGVRELHGPRHQVPPATARGKTACGVSRGVARGCWEGPISPPDPKSCPVPALPPFPQPHRPPWGRVSGACGRANLCAPSPHPPRRSCLQHDSAAQLPISTCKLTLTLCSSLSTELRRIDGGAACRSAKITSPIGSRSCDSAAATRHSGPIRLHGVVGGGRCSMQQPRPRPSLPVWVQQKKTKF